MSYTTALVDDHPAFRYGVRMVLEQDGGFEIVAEVEDGSQVQVMVRRVAPQLLLIDLDIPRCDGITCIERLYAEGLLRTTKAIVISGTDQRSAIRACLAHGAWAFLSKSIEIADIPAVLRSAARSAAVIPSGFMMEIAEQLGLTNREADVLRQMGAGRTNAEIAEALGITEHTVKAYGTLVFRKINVTNRSQAAIFAKENGLSAPPPAKGVVQLVKP